MAALNREPVIGRYAFYNCTCLSGITFLGTAPTVGDDAFFNVAERA